MKIIYLLLPLAMTIFNVSAFGDFSSSQKGYSCWAGLGMFTGDVTYKIGGAFVDPSHPQLNGQYPFPVSKLQFPLDVTVATIGNEFSISPNWDIRGELGKNITTHADKQEDTDYSFVDAQPLYAYSKNDSDVQTITVDIGLRYWAARGDVDNTHLKFGVGAAYFYENLNWRLSNLNQTNYFDNNGYLLATPIKSTQTGIIGTYEATTSMPYIEVVAGEQTDSFSLLFSLGYSPFAQISDEDNHMLRQIYSTTNLIGDAYKISIQTKYDITENWFLMAKWDWLNFDLTGTESDIAYDGSRDTWTEGHEISSTQSTLSFSVGAKF